MKLRKRGCGINAGTVGKSLGKRGDISIWQIELNAFDPMYRKENHGWRNRPALFQHGDGIIK